MRREFTTKKRKSGRQQFLYVDRDGNHCRPIVDFQAFMEKDEMVGDGDRFEARVDNINGQKRIIFVKTSSFLDSIDL